MSDADWRDVTPATPGFNFQVQMHPDGRARHRAVVWIDGDLGPGPGTYLVQVGAWLPGWPGKGLQW